MVTYICIVSIIPCSSYFQKLWSETLLLWVRWTSSGGFQLLLLRSTPLLTCWFRIWSLDLREFVSMPSPPMKQVHPSSTPITKQSPSSSTQILEYASSEVSCWFLLATGVLNLECLSACDDWTGFKNAGRIQFNWETCFVALISNALSARKAVSINSIISAVD